MSSRDYRYYQLDGVGHLHGAEWFKADSDENAIAFIAAKYPDSSWEIWEGERMVSSQAPSRRAG